MNEELSILLQTIRHRAESKNTNDLHAAIIDLDNLFRPPIRLDEDDTLRREAFATTRCLVALMKEQVVTLHEAYVLRASTSLFAMLTCIKCTQMSTQKMQGTLLVQFFSSTHEELSNHIFSSAYVVAYVRCILAVFRCLDTKDDHASTCEITLQLLDPLFQHLLNCNIFDATDISILRCILAIINHCFQHYFHDPTIILTWLTNINTLMEKPSLVSLYTDADFCFFSALSRRNRAFILVRNTYLRNNVQRIVGYIRKYAEQPTSARYIQPALELLYANYAKTSTVFQSNAGILLSGLVSILQLIAHYRLNGDADTLYERKFIMRFIHNLLTTYPALQQRFISTSLDTLDKFKESPMLTVACFDAIVAAQRFFTTSNHSAIERSFNVHIPRCLKSDVGILRSTAIRTVTVCLPFLTDSTIIQDSITSLVGSLCNSSESIDDIHALFVKIVVEDAYPNVVLRHIEKIMQSIAHTIFHGKDDATSTTLLLVTLSRRDTYKSHMTSFLVGLVNLAIRLSHRTTINTGQFHDLLDVIANIIEVHPHIDDETATRIHVLLTLLIDNDRIVFREGVYTLLSHLISAERDISLETRQRTISILRLSDARHIPEAQALVRLYHSYKPEDCADVISEMLILLFNYNPRHSENTSTLNFIDWAVDKHVDFPLGFVDEFITIIRDLSDRQDRASLLARFIARLLLSSCRDTFIKETSRTWCLHELFCAWTNAATSQQTSRSTLRVVHSALDDCRQLAPDYIVDSINRSLETINYHLENHHRSLQDDDDDFE